ncbi:hypothetical protein [Streptomyces sp. NPDC056192]|uniref:hypothetical protein n=1 Tax=Streptomyces sp. NPDC056192 TaxID=3345743 RepID=UPI0035E212C1
MPAPERDDSFTFHYSITLPFADAESGATPLLTLLEAKDARDLGVVRCAGQRKELHDS